MQLCAFFKYIQSLKCAFVLHCKLNWKGIGIHFWNIKILYSNSIFAILIHLLFFQIYKCRHSRIYTLVLVQYHGLVRHQCTVEWKAFLGIYKAAPIVSEQNKCLTSFFKCHTYLISLLISNLCAGKTVNCLNLAIAILTKI